MAIAEAAGNAFTRRRNGLATMEGFRTRTSKNVKEQKP